MSRKTNSTSLKLGKTQLWTVSAQQYGKSLSTFFNFKICYYLFLLMNILTHKTKFSWNLVNCHVKFNQLFIVIYAHNEEKCDLRYTKLLVDHFKKLNYNCVVQVYPKEFMFSSSLIVAYFKKLLTLNLTPKKGLLMLTTLLTRNIGISKNVYSKYGAHYLLLKGFKIRITGRLENSKSPMTQTLEQVHGNLSLIKLTNYVEYTNFFLFSKLGTCNFQIWLFYKIVI
uniref:ribosomal protein S3 n=1 Tax=Antithamnionella miharai TaxID=536589 RepID=UPI002E75FB59|nr:ribosomal protein S3 [Antithamnionella miharai]WQF69334.1 ribosomal protein S3 [Antithamnionella miharai]WQF69359.1 ribosomal protein S3 [Antithamnionella miharai]